MNLKYRIIMTMAAATPLLCACDNGQSGSGLKWEKGIIVSKGDNRLLVGMDGDSLPGRELVFDASGRNHSQYIFYKHANVGDSIEYENAGNKYVVQMYGWPTSNWVYRLNNMSRDEIENQKYMLDIRRQQMERARKHSR